MDGDDFERRLGLFSLSDTPYGHVIFNVGALAVGDNNVGTLEQQLNADVDRCDSLTSESCRGSIVVGEGEEVRTSDTDVVACSLRHPLLPCATILSDRRIRSFASGHWVHEHAMLPNR